MVEESMGRDLERGLAGLAEVVAAERQPVADGAR
jgi:hypothetical protein